MKSWDDLFSNLNPNQIREKRNLLYTDLCGRQPYGVTVRVESRYGDGLKCFDTNLVGVESPNTVVLHDETRYAQLDSFFIFADGMMVRPYLRRMDSMTEREEESRCVFLDDIEGGMEEVIPNYVDWLNSRHFDYRGLIPKGLALEAPDGMYPESCS